LVLLGVLFTVSGGVALVAEQCFERLLSTLVGASTPAAATVLAVYFAGLTLGGYGYGRWLRPRSRRGLYVYGVLEALVGAWAFVLFVAFDHLIPMFAPLLRLGEGHVWLLQTLRVVVSACWILPLTLPMGATFPALIDGLAQVTRRPPGKLVARFYALNLVGAILGAALGPFFIFPVMGIAGALLVGALMDFIVALLAVRSGRTLPEGGSDAPETGSVEGEASSNPRAAPARARVPAVLLVTAAMSGFLLFALEVVWTHLHSAVLGVSVYAFAAVLTLVLLGLGVAGILISAIARGRDSLPAAVPAAALLLGAVALLLLEGVWPKVPHMLSTYGGEITDFAAGERLRWAVGALLLLPPATALGLVYPSLFRLREFPVRERGGAAGLIGAVNALGAISGALCTSFVLLPHLGSQNTLTALALACGASGVVLGGWCFSNPSHQESGPDVPDSGRSRGALCAPSLAPLASLPLHRFANDSLRESRKRGFFFLGVGAALVVMAFAQPRWNPLELTSGMHVYFRWSHVNERSRLLSFHEDVLGGMTTVIENPGPERPVRILLTNGKFQGNDAGEVAAQRGFALAPAQFVSHFDDALVIGLGTGQTGHIIHSLGFGKVDIAEIAPGMVAAAGREFAHLNHNVLDQPNVELFLEDGRNLLLLRDKSYDLITMEVASVWWAGTTNLYSREFYEVARRRLREGGVFQQWIQIHHIGTTELVSAILTLRSAFPNVSFWVIGDQGVLVATPGPQQIQPAFLARAVERAPQLGWAGFSDEELGRQLALLTSKRLLGPRDVDRLADAIGMSDVLINTDRNRYLEYATPRYNYSLEPWEIINVTELAVFSRFPAPVLAPGCSGPIADALRGIGKPDYLKALSLKETKAKAAAGEPRAGQ
jgi:spermidine synthase